jgi:nitric oxide reductase activation protein
LDTNRGHAIRKLHRIATDQKIFAERVEFQSYSPQQVIILVDYSGSMQAPVSWSSYGGWESRLEKAIQAAAGAALGLVEGRCEVAVYGHTADWPYSHCVTIYQFKSFRDPVENLAFRLDPNDDVSGSLTHENRDGYALEYIAKKFQGPKRKRLIHISDGAPAARNYSGLAANQHCKSVVDAVRAKGIEVTSISITEEARKANDFIYGKNNNIYNQDPNVVELVIRSMYERG